MLPIYTGKFEDNELLYAFKKFDTDNSGKITVQELRQILAKVGQYFTEEQIANLIATVDSDNDGKLSFQGKI
jgi:Ca2+-binding EF-hand superfamily protein